MICATATTTASRICYQQIFLELLQVTGIPVKRYVHNEKNTSTFDDYSCISTQV